MRYKIRLSRLRNQFDIKEKEYESKMQHLYPYIIPPAIGIVVAVFVYAWSRTIGEYDKRFEKGERHIGNHETRLSTLEGEHKMKCGKK